MHDDEIRRNLAHTFDLLDMNSFADELTRGFSTGMRQKTVLMRALVTDPQVLILDEPTSGLDFLAARSLVDHVRVLREEGRTILFATHILSEVEELADRAGIIARGKLRTEGTLEEMKRVSGKETFREIFFDTVEAAT
jgi:sodium transport system ATP-binding protein